MLPYDILTISKVTRFSFSILSMVVGNHMSLSLYAFCVDRLDNSFSIKAEGELFKCEIIRRRGDVVCKGHSTRWKFRWGA